MKQYIELGQRILAEGELRHDRTGVGTISVFGANMQFDLRERFPLVTVKETCRHEDVRPYGNSASFDLPKIATACQRADLPVPWHYVNERCFRTMRAMYPSVEYNPADKGTGNHNALEDAKFQVEHLWKIANRNKAKNA